MNKKVVLIASLLLLVLLFTACNTAEPVETQTPSMESESESMETETESMETEMDTEMDESMEAEMETDSMMVGEMMDGYYDVTPEQAKQLIDTMPELVIIDVSPAYAQGHLPGAINYYVGDGSLDEAIPTLDPAKTYLVYCHSDSASISGATKLVNAGFENVYRLIGNYGAWVAAGYEVEQ